MSSSGKPRGGRDRSSDRLIYLIDAYLHSELSPEGLSELEAALKTDPRAVTHFIAVTEQAGMMREVFGESSEQLVAAKDSEAQDFLAILSELDMPEGASAAPVDFTAQQALRAQATKQQARLKHRSLMLRNQGVISDQPKAITKAAVWLGLAAIIGLAAWIGWPNEKAVSPGASPAGPAVAAMLREEVDAQWASRNSKPYMDQPTDDRIYELISGIVRFEMGQGASVLIEGPARVRILGPSRLRIETGRLTAEVSEGSHRFTVETPTAEIMGQGNAFGVETTAEAGTYAEVFDGTITLSMPGSRDRISLESREAARVDVAGTHIQQRAPQADRFVQRELFDALAGHGDEQSCIAAVRKMWERDPHLIAAKVFSQSQPDVAYGWLGELRLDKGDYSIGGTSLGQPQELAGMAGCLLLNVSDAPTLFFDLDLGADSPAERAGLLLQGRRKIGRDGTRICLAWSMRLESGEPGYYGYAGLSLFDGHDNREIAEQIFFGHAGNTQSLGAVTRRPAGEVAIGDQNQFDNHLVEGGNPIERDRVYRWLVVIDFFPGADRVTVYLDPDPDPERLSVPAAIIDDVDIRFDRLRIEADKDGCRWAFDDLRLGTEIGVVLVD